MTRLYRIAGCLALAAVVFGCGPAPRYPTYSEKPWATPTQRWEGCCQSQDAPVADKTPRTVATASPVPAQSPQDQLEAIERRRQALRDSVAKAEADRRAAREARKKARAEVEAVASEVTMAEAKASSEPHQLCIDLHPEAHYMAPPDEEGTMHFLDKQVADFEDFASCFNQRYGGAFAAQDFRPCNSIPGISETDRLECLFNEERPRPRQWCNKRFDYERKKRKNAFDRWRHCTNEINVLSGLTRMEPDKPKTAVEMKQDERDFMENASAYARESYRGCILQLARQTDAARQSCRDFARGAAEVSKSLHDFIENFDEEMLRKEEQLREESPLHRIPSRLDSPAGTY